MLIPTAVVGTLLPGLSFADSVSASCTLFHIAHTGFRSKHSLCATPFPLAAPSPLIYTPQLTYPTPASVAERQPFPLPPSPPSTTHPPFPSPSLLLSLTSPSLAILLARSTHAWTSASGMRTSPRWALPASLAGFHARRKSSDTGPRTSVK